MSDPSSREHPFSRVLLVGASPAVTAASSYVPPRSWCALPDPDDEAWGGSTLVFASVPDKAALDVVRERLDAHPGTPVVVAADGDLARAATRMGAFAVVATDAADDVVRRALADVLLEHDEASLAILS